MVKNDSFSYLLKKSLIDHKSGIIHALITQERLQQFELLIHLISNSKQAIVICGPEGIGKSTFLKVLQEHTTNPWFFCHLQGKPNLSFEKIQEQAVHVINQQIPYNQANSLAGFLRLVQNQNKKLVLMIDDSGGLAPGVISTILDYAERNPILRVILVLTHDELYAAHTSDSRIDDCHLIEIPALSENQCREFLHSFASKHQLKLRFNTVSDEMLEAVYLKTQGIPDRIIAEFPGFMGKKQSDNSLWILISAVSGLIILALLIQWYSGSEYNLKSKPTPTTAIENETEVP